MAVHEAPIVNHVIGADGLPLVLSDLPSADTNTTRWTARQKANVVNAVRGGIISLNDASQRYMLTVDELWAWEAALDRFGLTGLRANPTQKNYSALHRSVEAANSANDAIAGLPPAVILDIGSTGRKGIALAQASRIRDVDLNDPSRAFRQSGNTRNG